MSQNAWAVDELAADAQLIRQSIGSFVGSAGGILAAKGLELTQKLTPDMHVLIAGGTPAAGGLWVPGYTTTTGPYYFQNTASFEQVIATAGASLPRVDTIVARVYDNAVDSLGKHEAKFESLKGTEKAGANLGNLEGIAAVPKNCYVLGYVEVKATVTEIKTENIKNVATLLQLANNVAAGQVYGAKVTRVVGTEYEPSATRATQVVVTMLSAVNTELNAAITVGGVVVGNARVGPAGSGIHNLVPVSFVCPAGQKWKVTGSAVTEVESSYLPL